MINGSRQSGELVEVGDFTLQRGAVRFGKQRGGLVPFVFPLLGSFVERLVIGVKFIFQRLRGFLKAQFFPKAICNRSQRTRDGKGRGCQQFAQHQRHEGALAGGQRLQIIALQILGNQMVEAVLALLRREFLHQGMALGEGNVGSNLPPQGAVTHRFKPLLEREKHLLLIQVRILFPEASQITKRQLVNKADQSKEFQ